jgi:Domain of unknown function (DUF4249)
MYKKYLSNGFIFLVLITLVSCLETTDIPIRQVSSKIVVEGLLTNETEPFLRLSLTSQWGNASRIEPLQGAYVALTSSLSETVIFRAVPQEIGMYKPTDKTFVGKEGVSYVLSIKLPDGREFKAAPQKMPTPVPIDNIEAKFESEQNIGFRVVADFKDPKETENFYRWTAWGYHQRKTKGVPVGFGAFCCNRCWVFAEEKSVNLFSDALVNGSTVRGRTVFFSPFYVLGKHLIEVQQYTISRESYQFWSRYKDQQLRTGTIFDPLPAALLGNMININDPKDIALGYFEVSAITHKRIEPIADTQGQIATNFDNELYVPDGDCMLAFPFSVYIAALPPKW